MKKMRVLALVLVFAFAALGGAYAMWSDTLIVSESVNTGTLDVRWSTDLHIPDPGPNYEGYPVANGNPPWNVYGVVSGGEDDKEGLDELDNGNPNNAKNIASMDAEVKNQESGDGRAFDNDNDLLEITLYNGYPGYQERIFTSIMNTGSVPAKLDLTALGIPEWLLVEIWFDADPTKAKDNGEDYMVWSSTGAASDLPLDGYQIDPGENIAVGIYTRVLQSAPQDKNKDFTIKLQAQQWNEYGFTLKDEIQTRDRKDPHFDSRYPNETENKYYANPGPTI